MQWMLIVQKQEHFSVERQEAARIFWLRAAMPATWMTRKRCELRDLTPDWFHTDPEFPLVRTRTEERIKRTYGAVYFPIFMA